jgi:hypothetical protein
MATYTLSGSGTQTLTANTTAAHLTITTLPSGLPKGRANPVNNFEIGLIRFGDGTGFWEPVPVLGGPQWIGVPNGATQFGYAMLNGSVVSFTEVIGGTSPFFSNNLSQKAAHLTADVSMSAANTFFDGPSLSLEAGTWLITAHVLLQPSAAGRHEAKLWDGTTTIDATEDHVFSGQSVIPMFTNGIVSLTTTKTLKMSCSSPASGCVIKAALLTNSPGNFASGITAVKVSS